MKFGTYIHAPQKMDLTEFHHPLTFVLRRHQQVKSLTHLV